MDEPLSFGYWVRRRRRALDLTQGELARRVGCAEVTIQKIEADERRPSRQIAELLAQQLAIAPEDRAAFLQRARGRLATDRLIAATAAPAVSASAAAPAALGIPHNLPVQLTSFIGRTRELATILSMLASARLLTLTGPGGTGKTRLALQLASSVREQFPDGVWLVELAPLGDPALIVQTIATVLGLREQPDRPLSATLIAHLRDQHLLLVLDNCEHMIDACALLAEDLLRACPSLRILASSREPLGIAGEVIFRVPALALPNLHQPSSLDQRAQVEALQLFVERAQAVQPSFQATEANTEQLIQICARLDGIPLAIELAAARVRMLTLEQIAARLDDRFQLLTGGSRTALPRHQALQALIDWSYELLAEDERILLRRLAVFAGGWTLEAAEAIYASADGDALEPLTRLVDKSLVEVEPRGTAARYRMLETIRQYALEKLAASGEADTMRHQHALYYLEMFEAPLPDEVDDDFAERSALFETENDNLRAALAWSQTATGGGEIGLRLVDELEIFWALRGYWTEGCRWMSGALAHPEAQARTQLRSQILNYLGSTHAYLNDYAAAQAAFAENLLISQELDNDSERAWALNRLGWLAREQNDTTTARARLEQSLEICRELGDQLGIAEGLNTLGEVAVMREDTTWALALLEEALALNQSLGHRYGMAWSLNHLGHAAQIQGDYERAIQLHTESLALFRESGEQHLGTAWALQGLGESRLGQGDLAAAQGWLSAGLAQFRALSDRAGMLWCLAGLGSLAALGSQAEQAARLWGAAEALRQTLGSRPVPAARTTYERARAIARAQLGDAAFASAWAAGQALSLDQALVEAVGQADGGI